MSYTSKYYNDQVELPSNERITNIDYISYNNQHYSFDVSIKYVNNVAHVIDYNVFMETSYDTLELNKKISLFFMKTIGTRVLEMELLNKYEEYIQVQV